MQKRSLMLLSIAVALGAAPVARAHNEYNGRETTRCDSWYRPGHFTDADGDGKPDEPYNGSHEHSSGSDINELRPVANTEIHSQSGHHVVRNDYGYVEVVGGQSYKGPNPQGKFFPGQGGYVQGEVDVAPGVPDPEFFVGFFGPKTDENPNTIAANPVAWANGSYAKVCVFDGASNRVEQQSRTP